MDGSNPIHSNDRLRQERIQRNWRQQDVADQVGTTVVTVNRWERGNQQPSAYFRVKLCALFGKSAEELGFVAESQQLEVPAEMKVPLQIVPRSSLPDEAPRLWAIPYARNPFFTGREDLLHTLHEQLNREHTMALTQSWAISGLGGIGKTQIALEYAYQYRHDYRSVFWLSAASRETLLAGFMTIADLLQLPEKDVRDPNKTIQAVKKWLASHQEWLLILDNADDLTLVHDVLPTELSGHLLLTTRAQAVGSLAQRIEVETMGMVEGTLFLLRRAKQLAPDEFLDQVSNAHLAAAEAIVIEMDFLPLALDQAGAYIEEVGCSLEAYLELYRTHRKEFLQRRSHMPSYHPEPVATTWSLSFAKIEQANPTAAELLRLCAFLEPDTIPEELISKGGADLGSTLQLANDELVLNKAIEELRKFSLVQRDAENRLLRIHRLVQAVIVDTMEQDIQHQWAERVVRAVNKVFPDDTDDAALWPLCLRYLSQVQACHVLLKRYSLDLIEAAYLFNRTVVYLWHTGLYSIAEPLVQYALKISQHMLGAEHSDMAICFHNLGRLDHAQGKYEQAEPSYLRALTIREQQVGPEHLGITEILNDLSNLYVCQGKHKQAETMGLRVLTIREQHLGLEHTGTAEILNDLALIYERQGKYEQAEALNKRALAICEQQLGLEHLNTAYVMNNLGLLYTYMGKYKQAEPLYQRSLAIWEQQLGPTHPDTAYALNNLGILYTYQGKYEQAEALHQRALAIREQLLGSEHPIVAQSLNNLANVYRNQGKYKPAEALYQKALTICEQQVGPEHPNTASVLNELALLYWNHGKYKQAESLYQRTLVIREQVLGAEHPKTRDTREHLHTVLQAMSETEKIEMGQ